MAGRSGRRNTPGQVILQTYNPNHPVIKAVQNGNYEDFVHQELKHRQRYNYPPFGKVVLVRTQSLKASKALQVAEEIKRKIQSQKKIQILGPAPAPLYRLRNKYRYHLLLKSSHPTVLKQMTGEITDMTFRQKAVQISVNVDPVYML